MTTADPYADIAAAKQEATEAEQLLAALEERVREGDAKVKPAQLAEQRELSRFAALRVEAAHRKLSRAAEDETKAVREQYAADVRDLAASNALDPDRLAEAYACMSQATAAFVAACDTYNTAWKTVRDRLHDAAHHGFTGPDADDLGVTIREVVHGHPQIRTGDRSLYRIRTGDHLARAIHTAASTEQHGAVGNLLPLLHGHAKSATSYQPDLAGGAQ
jgi:hypothetical protein